MELGATVCLPRSPQCVVCPVEKFCGTKGEHVAAPRKQIISRITHYALVTRPVEGESKRTEVLLVQRPDNASQMASMWELPALEEAEQERAGVAHPSCDYEYEFLCGSVCCASGEVFGCGEETQTGSA